MIIIPSAKIMSATRGWTSFFMKNRTPEFSVLGEDLTVGMSAPVFPALLPRIAPQQPHANTLDAGDPTKL
jgi:hypothetical protein